MNVKNWRKCLIGEDCYFDTLTPENITIEENVLITKGCSILTHYYDPQTAGYSFGKVHFKHHCFIGWNVTICKSVTIGAHSVVGAGSVVTKDIPDYEVWAGVPAKFIRRLNHEDE